MLVPVSSVVSTLVAAGALTWVWQRYASRTLPARDSKGQKTVLVTGCDSGFGLRTVHQLSAKGYKVLAGCYTQEGITQFKDTANVQAFRLDVTSQESVDATAALVAETCPEGLHSLVNNAGILHGELIDFLKMKDIRMVFEVNYFGVVAMTMALLPHLRRRKGHLVNVASIGGRMAGAGLSAYASSKFAVEAFSDSCRREQKIFGVKVSIIEPGFMKTEGLVALLAHERAKDYSHVPQETLALYGEEFRKSVRQLETKTLAGSANPQMVVDKICHAVCSASPRTHYVVGTDAHVISLLVHFPACVLDFILSLPMFNAGGAIKADMVK